jgi:SAM-dependent methyltransferase
MDEQFTEPFWNERYSSASRVWSGDPNPQLVREAAELPAGAALDAGCGEGGDAHWLAGRGWLVTALDISRVALERGAAHADPEVAERITWEHADLSTWVADGRTYDLVSAQFEHFPREPRERLFAQLAASVAAGGTLLIVGHDVSDLDIAAHPHAVPDMYFTAGEVAAALDPDRWDVLVAQSRPRSAIDPDGQQITVSDAVLRARNRP